MRKITDIKVNKQLGNLIINPKTLKFTNNKYRSIKIDELKKLSKLIKNTIVKPKGKKLIYRINTNYANGRYDYDVFLTSKHLCIGCQKFTLENIKKIFNHLKIK